MSSRTARGRWRMSFARRVSDTSRCVETGGAAGGRGVGTRRRRRAGTGRGTGDGDAAIGSVARARGRAGAGGSGKTDGGVLIASFSTLAGAVREDVVQRAAESGGGGGARVARRRAGFALDVHEEARAQAVEGLQGERSEKSEHDAGVRRSEVFVRRGAWRRASLNPARGQTSRVRASLCVRLCG